MGQVAHPQVAQAAAEQVVKLQEGVEALEVVVLAEEETEEAVAAWEAAEEGHAEMAPAVGCAVASVAAVACPQASVAAQPAAETMAEVAVVAGALLHRRRLLRRRHGR